VRADAGRVAARAVRVRRRAHEAAVALHRRAHVDARAMAARVPVRALDPHALGDALAVAAHLAVFADLVPALDLDADARVRFARRARHARELAARAVRHARPAVTDVARVARVSFVDHAVAVVVDRVALLGRRPLIGNAREHAGAALHRPLRAEPLHAG